MKVVIDTNILISALIKDSITRRLIVKSGFQFNYPEMSFHELRKHKSLVLDKSGMSEVEYMDVLNDLLSYVNVIPDEAVTQTLEEAAKLMGKIDPDDVVFLAAALTLDAAIWSDDAHFDRQKRIKIFKTKEMARLFL
ncbi:PIN domain-containing protein [Candidatus Woesearchaeota archaeon]|nr:PIN domain-containing protein [Candidatus Woesearchaeota archaeon]